MTELERGGKIGEKGNKKRKSQVCCSPTDGVDRRGVRMRFDKSETQGTLDLFKKSPTFCHSCN